MALETVLLVDQERFDKVDFDSATGLQLLVQKALEETSGNMLGAPAGLLSPTSRSITAFGVAPALCTLTSFSMVSNTADDTANINGFNRNLSWDGPVTRFDPSDTGTHSNHPVNLDVVVAAGAASGSGVTAYIWARPIVNNGATASRRVWDVGSGLEVAQNIPTRGLSRLEFVAQIADPGGGYAPIVRLNIDNTGDITSSQCVSVWDDKDTQEHLFASEASTGGVWSDLGGTTQVSWLLENMLDSTGGADSLQLSLIGLVNNITASSVGDDRGVGLRTLLEYIRFQLHRMLGRGVDDNASAVAGADSVLWMTKPSRSIQSLYYYQEILNKQPRPIASGKVVYLSTDALGVGSPASPEWGVRESRSIVRVDHSILGGTLINVAIVFTLADSAQEGWYICGFNGDATGAQNNTGATNTGSISLSPEMSTTVDSSGLDNAAWSASPGPSDIATDYKGATVGVGAAEYAVTATVFRDGALIPLGELSGTGSAYVFNVTIWASPEKPEGF